jgi:hypothetical protein
MASKEILTRLDDLRRFLTMADGREDGSFARVFNAFFDIAEDTALLEVSEPASDPGLRVALERAARRLTRDERTTLEDVGVLRCAGAGMSHGVFHAGRYRGTFFYFEREQQGLVAFSEGGPMINYMRITLTAVPEGAYPVPGPKGPQ